MKIFEYTVKDKVGLHARPAGLLAKKAKEFTSEITLTKDGKTVLCTKLMALMGLGITCGDTVTVTASGDDEELAIKEIKTFFESNL